MDLQVIRCSKQIAKEFVDKKHYLRTLGMYWESFCLVDMDCQIMDMYRCYGVVVYGQPNPSIQKYGFGPDRDFRVYELTRLVLDNDAPKNSASILVGRSLKMLSDQPCAVVSYADTSMGHSGIVYQATNWVYTGKNKSHDKIYIVNGERVHAKTIQDRFGVTSAKKFAKENPDIVKSLPPVDKHRYFYFVGSKGEKARMKRVMRYKVLHEYPKSDKMDYDNGKKLNMFVDRKGKSFVIGN